MFGIAELSNTQKSIITMCHLQPLPGDPLFNQTAGITDIIKKASYDIDILQCEHIQGILFSNEFSYPYTQKLSQVTVASMARIIGELKHKIKVPFGVDCMYDGYSTIDLALATDADFCRITLTPAMVTAYELGTTEMGSILRHAMKLRLNQTRIIFNIDPSVKLAIKEGTIKKLIKLVVTQARPDALCVSSESINKLCQNGLHLKTDISEMPPLICDGGCNIDNIHNIIDVINGVIVGTALKEDCDITKPISQKNTREFLAAFIASDQ